MSTFLEREKKKKKKRACQDKIQLSRHMEVSN